MALIITRVDDTLFDFQEDGGIVKTDGKPTLSTFGVDSDFKTSTGSNLYQKIALSDITVVDQFGGTGSFTFTTILALRLKLQELKFFDGAASAGGGGVDRFDHLIDGFDYEDNNGKIPVVNEAQLRLDPTVFFNVENFTQLGDAPNTILANKMIIGNQTGDKLIFAEVPGEPQQFYNASGFVVLHDGGVLQNYTSGEIQITNDLTGVYTTFNYKPYGISSVWNTSGNFFYFNDLRLGDTATFNLNFNVTTSAANQQIKFKLRVAIGTPNERDVVIYDNVMPNAGINNISFNHILEIFEEEVRVNEIQVIFESSTSCVVVATDWRCDLVRSDVNEVTITDHDTNADHYIETYDAATNTPPLTDVLGSKGDYYDVVVAGTVDFGSGNITLGVGDILSHNGLVFYKSSDNNQSGGTPFELNVADKFDNLKYTISAGQNFKTKGFELDALNKTFKAIPHTAKVLFLSDTGIDADAEVGNPTKPFGTANACLEFLEALGADAIGYKIQCDTGGNFYYTINSKIVADLSIENNGTAKHYIQTGVRVTNRLKLDIKKGELICEIKDTTILNSSGFFNTVNAKVEVDNIESFKFLDSQVSGTISLAFFITRTDLLKKFYVKNMTVSTNKFVMGAKGLDHEVPMVIEKLIDNIPNNSGRPIRENGVLKTIYRIDEYINNTAFSKLLYADAFALTDIRIGKITSPNATVTILAQTLTLDKSVEYENTVLPNNAFSSKTVINGNGHTMKLNSPLVTGTVIRGNNATKVQDGYDINSNVKLLDLLIDINPSSNYSSFVMGKFGTGEKGIGLILDNYEITGQTMPFYSLINFAVGNITSHAIVCKNSTRITNGSPIFTGAMPVGVSQDLLVSQGAKIYHDHAVISTDPNAQTTVNEENNTY